MEHDDHAAAGGATVDHGAHQGLFDELMGRAAACFARRETRLTCRDMVHGLLAELEDHNCWTMAEAAGHPGPHKMQHLLSRARIDEREMTDACADWVTGHLSAGQDGDVRDVVLIVDETGDEKSSPDRVAAARQYSGTTGGTALCHVAVTLTNRGTGRARPDRPVPRTCPNPGPPTRSAATWPGSPTTWSSGRSRSSPGTLLKHAHDQGIGAAFIAGDEVYGGLDLRKSIRERGTGYVLAVRSNYQVTLPSGRRVTVNNAAHLVQPGMWQRMRTGQATKDYHWAVIAIKPDDTPEGHDGHAFLLLRKHRYTGTVSYHLCRSPEPVPLAKLIQVPVARWKIEEDHQIFKQVTGLDSGQVTTWTSWHRWTAISLLAYAFLAVAAPSSAPETAIPRSSK